jgi:ligand-binding sensor domain-containing protein
MYDPRTKAWKTYPTSSPARRIVVDSVGNVWACLYGANGLVSIDPERGKVTEHAMPLKYGNPYAVGADSKDNLWLDNANYNSLVKFDQRANKFTYVPFPTIDTHAPLFETDSTGTMWYFSIGTAGHGEADSHVDLPNNTRSIAYMRKLGSKEALSELVAFKPEGNVPPKGASQ